MKKQIIILEGSDCSGKSTLARQLQQITGFDIVKGSSFQIAELGNQAMFEHMLSLSTKDRIIIDRMYISNYIYGELFDFPRMDMNQFHALRDAFNKKSLTIVLQPSLSAVTKRLSVRGDDEIKTNDLQNILDNYLKVLTDNTDEILTEDTFVHQSDDFISDEYLLKILDSNKIIYWLFCQLMSGWELMFLSTFFIKKLYISP